jgi:hypothetical protein
MTFPGFIRPQTQKTGRQAGENAHEVAQLVNRLIPGISVIDLTRPSGKYRTARATRRKHVDQPNVIILRVYLKKFRHNSVSFYCF